MRNQPIIVPRVCEHCATPFTVRASPFWLRQIEAGERGRFCSFRCTTASRNRQRTEPPIDRFWRQVDRSGVCWLWQSGKGRGGYGKFWVGPGAGRTHVAHRWLWEYLYGPLSADDVLMHNCPGGDNPACVNPSHLRVGTLTENNQDTARKGRQAAKLTAMQVREIRACYTPGPGVIAALARQYGIGWMAMRAVVRGVTWRHVTPADGPLAVELQQS